MAATPSASCTPLRVRKSSRADNVRRGYPRSRALRDLGSHRVGRTLASVVFDFAVVLSESIGRKDQRSHPHHALVLSMTMLSPLNRHPPVHIWQLTSRAH